MFALGGLCACQAATRLVLYPTDPSDSATPASAASSKDADADGDADAIETGETWRIAHGHHPYISNGAHGNGGNYEGVSWQPVVNGERVISFMESHVCGKVDVYLCGHDHNRQWLGNSCGTEFIVTGSAAKTTDLEGRDGNATLFEDDTTEGFLWVEIRDNTLTGEFYDREGTLQFSHTITK